MSDKILYTIIVHSENIAGLLNQVTAVFTRRQINIESLNVSASSIKGVHKYTITAWTDKDTIEKVVKQIEKKIDVIQAHYFTEAGQTRSIAVLQPAGMVPDPGSFFHKKTSPPELMVQYMGRFCCL